MKVQIFMCGEGLGHTSRSLASGERLIKEGHEVMFCAYGYSKKHLEDNGYKVSAIPSEIKLAGKAGSFSMRKSIEETLKGTDPIAYPKIYNMIKKEKPNVVISDSYFMAAFAAKMNKTPLLFIVNQTNTSAFFANRGIDVKIIGKLVGRFQDTAYQYIDNLIIPDFPPPYTICEKNLDISKDLVDKIHFTGPLVRKRFDEVEAAALPRPHVLSLIGGFGYREKLLHNVIEAAKLLEDYNFTLVTGPNTDAEKLRKEVGDNVKVMGHLKNTLQQIKGSDVIAAPGGHSTIMEALSFGKPLLSFPDMFHSEQENNAAKLHELGAGMHLSYFTPPYAIAECIHEATKFKKSCERLRHLSEKMDGTKKMVELVEEVGRK